MCLSCHSDIHRKSTGWKGRILGETGPDPKTAGNTYFLDSFCFAFRVSKPDCSGPCQQIHSPLSQGSKLRVIRKFDDFEEDQPYRGKSDLESFDYPAFQNEEEEPDYHHHQSRRRRPHRRRNLHKAPFYAEIAGYNPSVGVILNPRDTIFVPGIEPGGLAGITPKFMKFLRNYVNAIGKEDEIPLL